MASVTFPNLGIDARWTYRESGWKPGMDDNLLIVDSIVQLSVIDRDLTAPPGGESDGDRYIVGPNATGTWSGHYDDIAVYVLDDTAYTFYTPTIGWRVYVEDEEYALTWDGTAWINDIFTPHRAETGTYTVADGDCCIECTSGTFTVNLQALSTVPVGRVIIVKNMGAGTITVDGNASETIDGATTQAMASQYDVLRIMRGASEWILI